MNISYVYAVIAALSLIIALAFFKTVKRKDAWLWLLCSCIFIVNIGYYILSVSSGLEMALTANRISYLGSVFLPLCMFMTIADACGFRIKKSIIYVMVLISVAVFVLAASGGYCSLYYKEVTFITNGSVSGLQKVYGSLHSVYLIYLVLYFSAMISAIALAVKEKRVVDKYASMMVTVVFLNISIWFLEQLVKIDFEFLSVSYIASEVILLFLYSFMQDYNRLFVEKESVDVVENKEMQLPDECPETEVDVSPEEENEILFNPENIIALLEGSESLTKRETDVLLLILQGKKRKEIAYELFVSENTVKTHQSRIFSKLGVSGKQELMQKVSELI